MKVYFLIVVTLILLGACSKKADPDKFTVEEFNALSHEAKPTFAKGDELHLSDYASGVNHKESRALSYQNLSFFAIAFETKEQAQAEALRLNQYYARNWLFDRVEGEPVLEDYVIHTFKAQNPKRRIQRVPKKLEATSGPTKSGHTEASESSH